MRVRARLALPLATLALHLAVAGRYGFFRDELYFIVLGRHPSWGYVDQPPLAPLLAAATQAFGESLVLLRAVPALAAAGTVWVTMGLASTLGARGWGVALAGLAAAIAPMHLGLMTTLGTTTFEPLLWTLLAWLIVRALAEQRPALWLAAGAVVGLDLQLKYQLPLWLAPALVALVATGNGRALLRREVAAALALAAAIAAPSLIWQLAHGLPFLELLQNQAREGKNVVLAPGAFLLQQVLVMNPLLAPLWLAGLAGPFLVEKLRPARWLSLAFALAFLLMMALKAKDYYLAPLYAPMFAAGGAALEERVRAPLLRGAWVAAITALSALAAPLAMPLLPEAALVRYLRATGLQPKAAETLRQAEIPQTMADMHGWRELTAKVTEAVRMLPPEEQGRVVILAHNYGEAAALDFFGRGLPPVITGHNHYYLWGLRGAKVDSVIAFNREVDEVAKHCREARELTRFYAPWVMPFEDDSAITLCRGLRQPLEELWPRLKLFY